ncbi:alpha/beta fold hydrolase [Streptomyces sp. IMTB 1903]|uniref:alpha/beta fold hydrolase n=1 Tax=Streptomyces sp. IMTB 1903 TaxID=1776680 RepID=UPI000B11CB32|nr:alpha/beta hydrolase [Streptomyces sp. IMTB 1903]
MRGPAPHPRGPQGAARPARTTGRTPGGTAYTQHGTGDLPVVLVAGGGGAGRIWEHHQVPALTAAGRRVVTFDHGPTAAAGATELAALTRELLIWLDLPPCVLVGHSLGALAVQELLLTDPHLASGALLAATRGRPDAVGEALARAEAASAAAGIRLPPEYEAFVCLVQNLSPRTLADENAAAEWLDLFEIAAATGASAANRPGPAVADRLAAYGRIRVPVLVLGFADDVLAPAPLGREVAAAIPGARYTELPDTGHLGFLERPEAFNTVLLDFLATLAPTDPGVPHAR